MSGKGRIQWSEEERASFLAAASTFGYPERGDTESVWKEAQERAGIAKSRRRPFDPAMGAIMNAERKKAALFAEPRTVAVPLTAPGQPIAKAEPEPVVPAPEPVVPEIERSLTEQLGEAAGELLVDALTRALYDTRVRSALRSLVAEVLAPEPELAKVEAVTWRSSGLQRERLPRVVVAGGRTSLRESLRDIRGVDLRMWGQVQGESPHRLWNLLREADACYVLVKDISHPVMHGIKAREKSTGSPPLKVKYWTDSAAELAVAIQEFAKKGDVP